MQSHRFLNRFRMVAMLAALVVPVCDAEELVDFARDVRPLLASRCFRCHGSHQQLGELRLDKLSAAVLQTIKSGEFVKRITSQDPDFQMPPSTPLSSEEAALLVKWVEQGAKTDSKFGSRHWAFEPIVRPAVPKFPDDKWSRNEVDAFILANARRAGLAPSGDAPTKTLLRRVSLDLTGLLPDLETRQQYDDEETEAWEQLVDRLLASPAFGERWGRHWLDIARYADSSGYEADQPRQIWAYRDWVISALNRDMPFRRFVIEQIAGDLLPNATAEQKIATGFQCNAIFDGGVRYESIHDQVNTLGATFLGLTLGCAQCHSHKSDPLTQKEYYQLYAFFDHAVLTELALPGHGKDVKTMVLNQQPKPTHIFVRGDVRNLGPKVQPETPSFLPPLATGKSPRTRLDLANWLVSDQNPLTARVTVNRIWLRLFGRTFVETESDFGFQTAPPSNLQLLDFLASELNRTQSFKHVIRLIVCSAAYRQSSKYKSSSLAERNFIGQRRLRLEAEVIRDIHLEASGLLTRQVGGPSVFPFQHKGILENRATPATWTESNGQDRYRRGMYTWVWRLTPHPHLPLFDAPDGVATCTRRTSSNVSIQAITLLNDPTFFECADQLAQELVRSATSDKRRLDLAFRRTLSRKPTQKEVDLLLKYVMGQRYELQHTGKLGLSNVEQRVWRGVARVLFNLDEFITRE